MDVSVEKQRTQPANFIEFGSWYWSCGDAATVGSNGVQSLDQNFKSRQAAIEVGDTGLRRADHESVSCISSQPDDY